MSVEISGKTIDLTRPGWDLDNASYDSKSYSVGSGTNPWDIFFKPDGLKAYTFDTANNDVLQLSLSTAWDISTASSDTSYDFSSQTISESSLHFSDSGSKMFILDAVSGVVYQYTLSTPWTVSSASYDSKSYDFGTTHGVSDPDIGFKTDGTKVYYCSGGTIYQYSLSTAWDISTASYDSVSQSIPTAAVRRIWFQQYGEKMFGVLNTTDTVYQYSMSTDWDITTLSYDSKTLSVTSQDVIPQGIWFKPDGLKFWLAGNDNDTIYQYVITP